MSRPTCSTTSLAAVAVVLAGLAGANARAADVALPAFTGYVVDQARVLDAASVEKFTAIASRLDKAGTAQLAVATLPSLGNATVEDLAVGLFKQWGLGHNKERSDGVLILYVPGPPGQRHTRVEVGYGLEGVLPDGKVGGFLRAHSSPLVRQAKYGEAAVALATAIAAEIDADAAAGGDSAATPDAPRGGRGIGTDLPPVEGPSAWTRVAALMGALFALLIAHRARHRFPGPLIGVSALGLGAATLYTVVTPGGLAAIVAVVVGLVANVWAWLALGLHRCSACRGWLDIQNVVVADATFEAAGLSRRTARCTACGAISMKDLVTPQRTQDTTSGSSDGGSSSSDAGSDSFSGGGGGESGGGGASSTD